MKMKLRHCASFFFLLILAQSGLSQPESNTDSLLSGLKGLTFTFSHFDLGGGLGGKYWFDESFVLKLTLTGSYRKDTDESTPTTSFPYNYNSSSTQFGISIGIAKRLLKNRIVFPYVGIAAQGRKSWGKIERVYANRTETERRSESTIGGSVFLGVEYWFVDHISLSGEQSLSVEYSMLENSKEFRIGNLTSSLQLSVYF